MAQIGLAVTYHLGRSGGAAASQLHPAQIASKSGLIPKSGLHKRDLLKVLELIHEIVLELIHDTTPQSP